MAAEYNDPSMANTTWNVPPAEDFEKGIYSKDYLDNYILGVDIGTLLEVEEAGGKFYDVDGYEVKDALEILKSYGINWVRLRLWVNPKKIQNDNTGSVGDWFKGGTNDLERTIKLAQRAKRWGMKIKLNFHYSDFWAHPGQQAKPRSWTGTTAAEIGPQLKTYTRQVLDAMQAAGVLPDIVQIGNENNTGIAGTTTNSEVNIVFRNGIEAVREACVQYNGCNCNVNKTGPYPGKHMRIMLHATNGILVIQNFFDARASLDYDIVGISYYPMWHGVRKTYQEGLENLAKRYNKDICLAEYSSGYTAKTHPRLEDLSLSNSDQRTFTAPSITERSVSGQANLIRNMNSDLMKYAVDSNGVRRGIGSFWWEPAWLPLENSQWADNTSREWYQWQALQPGGSTKDAIQPIDEIPRTTWGNQGFFTYEGTVIPSANAFLQLMGKQPRNYTSD